MDEPLIHIVYKTTHIPSGRYYIGVHSTRILEDGYLGSGRELKTAIEQNGLQAFKREVLGHFPTRQAASDCERTVVNQSVVDDPMSFNLVRGGASAEVQPWPLRKAASRGWCMGLIYETLKPDIR